MVKRNHHFRDKKYHSGIIDRTQSDAIKGVWHERFNAEYSIGTSKIFLFILSALSPQADMRLKTSLPDRQAADLHTEGRQRDQDEKLI